MQDGVNNFLNKNLNKILVDILDNFAHSTHMNKTNYSHARFLTLLEKAGSKANLSANTNIPYGTLRELERNSDQVPTQATIKKLLPFINGKKIQQLKRRYRRKA